MFAKFMFFSLIWCFFVMQDHCYGLHIQRLIIPNKVKANSSEVILDCHYKIEEWDNTDGLVVKWYMNNINLVYQWIPPRQPTVLGNLKGRIDVRYQASRDSLQEHRALRIINPDPSLSGTYTCNVATFDQEDSDSASLLIWAPPSDLRVNYWRPSAYIVNISCSSINASPKPTFRLYIISPNGDRQNIEIENRNDQPGSSIGLYDSHSWGIVMYKMIKKESVIGCSVSTIEKTFHETRETIYHADTPIITTETTTTLRSGEEAIKSPSIASLAISFQNPYKVIGFEITLLLFIVLLNRK